MKARPSRLVAAALLAVAGCTPPPASSPALPHDGAEAVPAGLGSLRQDDFSIELRSAALLVKATPLAEDVISLAAPDTYKRLRALRDARLEEARLRSGERQPQLLLVSFFSYEPATPFQPEELQITSRGELLRPLAILPLNPAAWGQQQLDAQQTQMAVYVFDDELDLEQPMSVRYRDASSSAWESAVLPALDRERARVRSRAGAGG